VGVMVGCGGGGINLGVGWLGLVGEGVAEVGWLVGYWVSPTSVGNLVGAMVTCGGGGINLAVGWLVGYWVSPTFVGNLVGEAVGWVGAAVGASVVVM